MSKVTGLRQVILAVAFVFVPVSAWAQGGSADARWFVGGLGGLTFGTVTSGAVGGQVGVRAARNLFVIGEVGRMQNVMPKKLQDDFDALIDVLEFDNGVPITVQVALPTTYGFAGVRWVQPGRVAPFLEAGVGFGHVSPTIKKAEIFGIDIKDELEAEIASDLNATEFLLALGGGVTSRLGRVTSLDAGYRFTRIATEDPAINSSMIYVAFKIGR
jgi:hypothetical protein